MKIIRCDRSNEYAKGAAKGTPDAIQVADRFHLFKNLREALELFLEQNHHCLRTGGEMEPQPRPLAIHDNKILAETEPSSSLTMQVMTRAEKKRQITRQKRLGKYEQVMELYAQGTQVCTIERQLGLHRSTVRKLTHGGALRP